MKAFLYGLLFFVIVAVGAFVYLKYFSPSSGTGSQQYKTEAVTKTGELRATTVAGSDFTHMLVAAGESVGVASYTLNLDDYIGKQVEIVGQYSGDTLYADTIQIRE